MLKTCFNCKYGNRDGLDMHCSEPTMKPIYDEIFASSLLMHSPDRIYTCREWEWDEITDENDEDARIIPKNIGIDNIKKIIDDIDHNDYADLFLERRTHLIARYLEIISKSGRKSCKNCMHFVPMKNGTISCKLLQIMDYYAIDPNYLCNNWRMK